MVSLQSSTPAGGFLSVVVYGARLSRPVENSANVRHHGQIIQKGYQVREFSVMRVIEP